jgi:hypothetical protein
MRTTQPSPRVFEVVAIMYKGALIAVSFVAIFLCGCGSRVWWRTSTIAVIP